MAVAQAPMFAPAPAHSSVAAVYGGLSSPPIAKEEVLSAPAPPSVCLAVLKSVSSLQVVPFQVSVFPVLGSPPAAMADV